MDKFLSTTKEDLIKRGIGSLDIILVSGDAYIDHPSFGTALIARYLESKGFSVGIIAQPDWKNDKDFLKLGKPKLFFGVTAGNLDSMVANYTADRKIRRTDMYSPDNKAGYRPDRATIVYTSRLKSLFKGTPIVIGGVEASLRRFAHYDFWDDKVRRSLLFDTKADYLIYGMAEHGIVELAEKISHGTGDKKNISNTAIITGDISGFGEALILPSYEDVFADKRKFLEAFKLYSSESKKKHPRIIIQQCQGRYLVVFPPKNLDSSELDSLFELPFARAPHPMYKNEKIPAWDFVKFSTISHRGCFGGCSFCSISSHQGKYVVSRSLESIKKEIKTKIIPQKDFKGNILDVGGPTANMYGIKCLKEDGCSRSSCIYPDICNNLDFSQKPSLKLLKEIRKIPEIKRFFINSGIRFDLALKDPEYMEELIQYHVGGQLSVAPEHSCDEVLHLMGKPGISRFLELKKQFEDITKKFHKKYFLVPYFIASHPGSTLQNALNLALFMKKNHMKIKQVQNFTPTPMTASTCMYYTGHDPFTGKRVHVPRGEERSFQRALLQPYEKKNYRQVVKALKILGKTGLIKSLTK